MDDIIKQKEISRPEKSETTKAAFEKGEPRPDKSGREEKNPGDPKPFPSAIKWEALEYEYIPKSNNWFWSIVIIVIGISFASILLGNMLFAIFVVIAGLAIILFGARKPREISFSLSAKGLQIEKRLFPYENLRSFWIHYDPPKQKLLTVELKKLLMPAISIQLGDTDPNAVREYLLKFLKEERREEPLVATITRLLRF
ncbi:MAG: hypothetical protein Q8N42_00535 [bacterium]|nr:hypothetical protein [bacterium]